MQNDLLRCDQSEVDFLLSIYNSKWEEEALQCGDAAGLVFDIDIPILPLPSVNADICASEACQMLYETMGNFETPELPNCEIDGMSSREALLMLLRQAIESWSTCTDFNIREDVVPADASTEATTDESPAPTSSTEEVSKDPTAFTASADEATDKTTASTPSADKTPDDETASNDESTDTSSIVIYIFIGIGVILIFITLVSCLMKGITEEQDRYTVTSTPKNESAPTYAANHNEEPPYSPSQASNISFVTEFSINDSDDSYAVYSDESSDYSSEYSSDSDYDSDYDIEEGKG